MLPRFGPLFVVACLALACQSSDRKRVEPVEPAAPASPVEPVESVHRGLRVVTPLPSEDLGIRRWVFADAPPAGEVMVLRRDYEVALDSRADVRRSAREVIAFTRGARNEEEIACIPARASAATEDPAWEVRGCAASTQVAGQLREANSTDNELSLVFECIDGARHTLRFQLRRESLKAARTRVPDLRGLSDATEWRFGASLTPDDKPK